MSVVCAYGSLHNIILPLQKKMSSINVPGTFVKSPFD